MTKNQISEGRGKQGLIAILIETINISILVSTTNASLAGAKNTKTSNRKGLLGAQNDQGQVPNLSKLRISVLPELS